LNPNSISDGARFPKRLQIKHFQPTHGVHRTPGLPRFNWIL
jgi:hypothetical protein